jgi:hypothetical protein
MATIILPVDWADEASDDPRTLWTTRCTISRISELSIVVGIIGSIIFVMADCVKWRLVSKDYVYGFSLLANI